VRDKVSVTVPRYEAIVDLGADSFINGSGKCSVFAALISLSKYLARRLGTSFNEISVS